MPTPTKIHCITCGKFLSRSLDLGQAKVAVCCQRCNVEIEFRVGTETTRDGQMPCHRVVIDPKAGL